MSEAQNECFPFPAVFSARKTQSFPSQQFSYFPSHSVDSSWISDKDPLNLREEVAKKMSVANTLISAQLPPLLFGGQHDGTSVIEPEVNSTTVKIF